MNRETGMMEKPLRVAANLTTRRGCAIVNTERVLPIDGLLPPVGYEKVTAKFGDLGRLLFLYHLDNQRVVSRPCHLQK